ncbi:MAG: hypothetical protein KAH38_12260, partial [Candidatus Hydrogenedentes bacterium]|nr:hypothetical protein [Candidatus Hydrogenedentota bacterium]
EQRIAENKVEEAETAYQEALTSFDALLHDENTAVARESAFNRANCLLRKASMIDSTQNYGEAVAALRLAVEAYETGAEKYPDHEGIRSNLVHTRFQLKQLLQNPAEQEEQPEQQPPPTLVSIFNNVKTEVPGANAAYEDNTAILTMPGNKETKP